MSNKVGRPLAQIDLAELEKLSAMFCTDTEIANWFGLARETIVDSRKRPQIAAVMERGRSLGFISLRRKQMQLAEAGNVGMLIWLGKQYLGQTDRNELTGANGGPLKLAVLYRNADGTIAPPDEDDQ